MESNESGDALELRAAKLGIEAERFLHSALGRHLVDRAQDEINDYVDKLVVADPEDTKINRELRNEIKVRESVINWINEVISSGKTAESYLESIE